jgi:RNA polymerase sigma factor (sigma-70 family)
MSAVMDGADDFTGPPPELLKQYLADYARLTAYFKARIGSPDEAKDLSHDLYLNLRAIPVDRVIDNPRGYLWRAAHNELCHFFERRSRSQPLDADDAAMAPWLSEDFDADERIDHATRVAALRKAWPLLSRQRRAVMELKWVHGMKREEIAARLGISVDTVKKHLKDGLTFLRPFIKPLE